MFAGLIVLAYSVIGAGARTVAGMRGREAADRWGLKLVLGLGMFVVGVSAPG